MEASIVRVREKFQITIPPEAREALKIDEGDELIVLPEGNYLHVFQKPAPEDVVERLSSLSRGRKFPGAMKEFYKDRKSW